MGSLPAARVRNSEKLETKGLAELVGDWEA